MYGNADYYAFLQYRCKALERRVADFESGEQYKRMKKGQKRTIAFYEKRLALKDREIERCHRSGKKQSAMWFEVFSDIQEEQREALIKKEREIDQLKQQNSELKKKVQELQNSLKEKTREVTQEREKALDEQEKNKGLLARIEQNFENSSIPSSKTRFRKKIPNNREKTGRKPGGQPGHEGHKRKKYKINGKKIFIAAPKSITENPDYYRQSGKKAEVHKLRVGIRISLVVDDMYADVYRNRKTGARYHAPFPANMQNEVNYDESIKSLVFIMKNYFNVSEGKISEGLKDLTGGELIISRGMINKINREFSEKSQKEQNDIFLKLVSAPVLYTDMTGARMNGQQKNIVVCTDKEALAYYFRDTKGDAAFENTPVVFFKGILGHDHDKTMYHYGTEHQECNEHHLRYLKGAMEMEQNLTWHGKMRSLLQEMNNTRNLQDRKVTEEQRKDFENRYDAIVDLADQEYFDNPPSEYYRKGYNLAKEFREYKDAVLLFLKNPEVDFTNNVSERAARKVGRHEAVSGTFRGNSNHSGEEYCAAMSVFYTEREKEGDTYQKIKEIFKRENPEKKKPGKRKNGSNKDDVDVSLPS